MYLPQEFTKPEGTLLYKEEKVLSTVSMQGILYLILESGNTAVYSGIKEDLAKVEALILKEL